MSSGMDEHLDLEAKNLVIGWTQWTEYGACSESCGYGMQVRFRACPNGVPGFGACEGSMVEVSFLSDIIFELIYFLLFRIC